MNTFTIPAKRARTPLRYLRVFLVCFLSLVCHSYASAADPVIRYTYSEPTPGVYHATVTGCQNAVGDIVIPETVEYNGNTYTVVGIGSDAFYGCRGLTSITIPEGVTEIGSYAFYGCSGLTSVTIPEGVTEIGSYAFGGCSGLTSVTIPEGVTAIGSYAFYGCSGLTSVTIPESVTSIGSSAFYYCSGLTSITIPESVTSIGSSAFYYCSGLTSITIPESVTSIGSSAFSGCSGLTGTLTIPEGVTEIGSSAFYGCSGLTGTLTIPEGVTAIGSSAFSGCSGLTGVNFNAINCSDFSSGDASFQDSPLTTFVFGDKVERIPAYILYGQDKLTGTLTIPESVTEIGSYAFYGCSGLTSVNFNAINCSDFSYGDASFRDSPLTTFVFGDKVERIPAYILYGQDKLTGTLTIPESVTSIGSSAFDGCSGLTSVNFNAINCSDFSSGDASFQDSPLTTFVFGDKVERIPAYILYGQDKLTGTLTIPESVTEIGEEAFYGCSGLTSVNFNAINCSDFSSGYAPFRYSPLTTFVFGDKVERIPAYILYGQDKLTGTLTIPEGVTAIGSSAFYGCRGLTGTLTIPESVTAIGSDAFSGRSGFTDFNIKPATPPTLGEDVFGDSYNLITNGKKAFIPDGTRAAYESSDWGQLGLIFVDNADADLTLHIATSGILMQEIKAAGYMPKNVAKLTLTGMLNDNDWAVIKSMTALYSLDISGIENTTMPSLRSVSRLIEFTFPQKLVSIPGYVLGSNITGTLTIPESVTSIGSSAFSGCNRLTGTLTIPDGVTKIGSYAFDGCSGLTGLTIGEGVTEIGSYAFSGCSGLTGEVVLPNSVVNLGDYYGSDGYLFANTGINAIVFGKNITRIPSDIVEGCTIDSITCYAMEPPTVDNNFVDVNTDKCKLKVPAGAKALYEVAPVWGNFTNKVEVDVPADMYLVKASAVNGRIVSTETGETLIAATVEKDSVLELRAVAEDGYRLASLMIDGVEYIGNVAEDGSFSTPAVAEAMNIEAVFTEITYTVKVYTVGSGAVTLHDVAYGGGFSMRIKADEGYMLESVMVSGSDYLNYLDEDGRLTLRDVYQDYEVVITVTGQGEPTDYVPERQSDGLTVWTVDGRVFVAADEVMRSVEVFDLNGRSLLSVAANATATDFGVPQRHTAYILKAHLADGTTRTAKVAVE